MNMPRSKSKKITTRLNYKHETPKGYQLLFEIRNYTVNPFRISVLHPTKKIMHLKKDQVSKDTVVNHPKSHLINNYLDQLKEQCRRTLEFLDYTKIETNKNNTEEYLYSQYDKVLYYYEMNIEDEDDAKMFYDTINGVDNSEQEKQHEIELGIYDPQNLLEILNIRKPPKIDTRLYSILKFYCEGVGISDIHYHNFNKKLLDSVIKHCINTGYKADTNGKIERYHYNTIFIILKMLRNFGKYLTDELGLKINQDYKTFKIRTGRDDGHIKYKWDDKNNVYTLYHAEFKKIENANFSEILDDIKRKRLEQARLMFLVQTYSGGVRISELYKIDRKSIIEVNGELTVFLQSPKTSKVINNPVTDKLRKILENCNFHLPKFENEQSYNDALKEMAMYLKLRREILQFDDYAHLSMPTPKKIILYEHFSSKLARKALVSILYNLGISKELISKITNHSKDTVEYYIALEEDFKRKMLNKI
jgi:hypothetical protein